MINKDKIMKSIECCLRPDNTNLCGECSYKNIAYDCKHALIKDVHELLKKQKAETEKLIEFINGFNKDAVPVVQCKDCRWFSEKGFCKHPDGGAGNIRPGNWFCADGERR